MSNQKNIALTYQQSAARGATPAAITGMIYDVAIESLHRAIRAIDEGKIEERVRALNKFFAAVAELRSALDYDRGGEVARRLGRFYQIARGEMLSANIKIDRATFEKHSRLFSELREAWRNVEKATAGAGAAAVSGPIRTVKAPPAEIEPSGSSWSA
ncbi:MAG TPA: flagellar export chaperone FliS [Candidatus Baltobacteraceae bacterium]|jgi:flagellar secretion chaperone FliS|nr:flagellar export chaperone FliS [Candidatus Baltobacteraceae bacterium]